MTTLDEELQQLMDKATEANDAFDALMAETKELVQQAIAACDEEDND